MTVVRTRIIPRVLALLFVAIYALPLCFCAHAAFAEAPTLEAQPVCCHEAAEHCATEADTTSEESCLHCLELLALTSQGDIQTQVGLNSLAPLIDIPGTFTNQKFLNYTASSERSVAPNVPIRLGPELRFASHPRRAQAPPRT